MPPVYFLGGPLDGTMVLDCTVDLCLVPVEVLLQVDDPESWQEAPPYATGPHAVYERVGDLMLYMRQVDQ